MILLEKYRKKTIKAKAFAIIGALIAILILGILGVTIAKLVSTNQSSSINEITYSKAFNAVQAGVEYAEFQRRNEGKTIAEIAGIYEFGNTIFKIEDGTNDVVNITGSSFNATSKYAVTIRNLPDADCLETFSGEAFKNTNLKRIEGIKIKRNDLCRKTFTISGIKSTWMPNNGEKHTQVQINGNQKEYNNSSTGVGSGELAIFDINFTLDTYEIYPVDYLQFKDRIDDIIDIQFELFMTDGSSKIFNVIF